MAVCLFNRHWSLICLLLFYLDIEPRPSTQRHSRVHQGLRRRSQAISKGRRAMP